MPGGGLTHLQTTPSGNVHVSTTDQLHSCNSITLNLSSGVFVLKESDKWEFGEVSQYAVIAEDLRRLLSAACSIRMIERGKIVKGKVEEKRITAELSIPVSPMSTSLSLPT